MRVLIPLLGLLLVAQADTFTRIDCRVSSVGPVVVDRGRRDGVQNGDRVFFYPRGGETFMGAVIEVTERGSVVEMRDKERLPVPGMRAEILVPAKRLAKRKTAAPTEPSKPKAKPKPDPEAKPKDVPEHPEWTNKDDEWEPGKPLLTGLKPVNPAARPRKMTGRAYVIGEVTQVPDSNYDNSLLRVGTEIVIENLIGKGGRLHLDVETGYVTDRADHSGLDLLLRQLSYAWGGTRFTPIRWEAGRFQQHGIPEFGMLDGGEWSYRFKSGHTAGVSMGFMPEPDEGLETQDDFQLAMYYRWIADVHERLTAAVGFQKTWHDGAPDRDLLVAKVRFLPDEGWDFHATLWIDFYTGKDNIKDSGIEVTQAQFFAGRRWASGNGVDVTYRHLRFPELLRDEFLTILDAEIEDNRYDRVAVNLWRWLNETIRLHGNIVGYNDEEGSGGAIEGGLDLRGLFTEGSRIDVVAFGNVAQFEDAFGGRLTVSRTLPRGRWEFFYEFSLHRVAGFPNESDDIIQHRIRGSATFYIEGGWDASVHAETVIYDEEFSWNLGFHVQRRF